MAISIAMVALKGGGIPSPADVLHAMRASWPDLPPAINIEQTDTSLAMRVGDSEVILGLMPGPIPWSDLEGPCATSWLWPEAETVLRTHDAHLVVTVSSDSANEIERACLLTQVIAAMVMADSSVVGVVWSEASLVVAPEMFKDFAVEMLPDSWPLYIWIDFRVGRDDDGHSIGFTAGLSRFGHLELETLRSPEEPGELRERLFSFASYLLENGPVLCDGDTIGGDEAERIHIKHTRSAFGHPGIVIRLEFPEP